MTALPTGSSPSEAAVVLPEVDAHVRLDRLHERRRLRLERAVVVLVLPIAVVTTLLVLVTTPGRAVLPAEQAVARTAARVEGRLPVGVAARLSALGIAFDQGEGGPWEKTEVVYYQASDREQAEAVARILRATVVVGAEPVGGGVDLTIRVGKDLQSE